MCFVVLLWCVFQHTCCVAFLGLSFSTCTFICLFVMVMCNSTREKKKSSSSSSFLETNLV
jgi:hypothetical protein